MSFEPRVLPSVPVESLQAHLDAGGGAGLDAARKVEAEVVIGELEASGLRGRGGGGFVTGTKWRTVAANRSDEVPTTVVVNAAEGEPGTFKDRAILRTNPYAVVEGALIAALVVGADRVIVAMKSDEAGGGQDRSHVEKAVAEVEAAPNGARRERSRCSVDRASTSTARRRRCSRCSTAGRRSLASPLRSGAAPTRSSTTT
ncbi:MAG: hypothetical protein WKF58_10045 [Ilumatobacteraceae bacterium]